MAEYNNDPFIVGDYNHAEIEFFHLAHQQWYIAMSYPFGNRIFGYAVVSRPGKIFILGGCCDENLSTVSLFENENWKKIGDLIQGRMNHMVIPYGTDVMIIGWDRQSKTNCYNFNFYRFGQKSKDNDYETLRSVTYTF